MSKDTYHWQTAYDRRRMSGHALDWAFRPELYKAYPDAVTHTLPREGGRLQAETFWDILVSDSDNPDSDRPSRLDISELLGLCYGINGAVRYPQEIFHYRSAPSAGALYPCEVYLAVYDMEGLEPGVYYYHVGEHALKEIRSGDPPGFFKANAEAGLAYSIFVTGIAYRSAWKYRARAYRYVLLDSGHLLGNLALILKAQGWPYRLVYDLDDICTGLLLGLDERREAPVARLDVGFWEALGREAFTLPDDLPQLPPEFAAASRVAGREVEYPEILRMMTAPPPATHVEVAPQSLPAEPDKWLPIGKMGALPQEESAVRALIRRRSSRNYVPRELSREDFDSLLSLVTGCYRGRLVMGPSDRFAIFSGFIAGNVAGLEAGFYLLDPENNRFGLVNAGQLTGPMAAACLDQAWLKHAGIHFLFMLNPVELDKTVGPRGYRYAMLQAGFLGQMVYLGATALGLGACGIGAIYDHEARDLLGLEEGSALGYLVAAGAVKRTK